MLKFHFSWVVLLSVALLGLTAWAMLTNPIYPLELVVLGLSIVLGVSMKIADLLVDDNLKWFRGSAILMGALRGLAGSLLILADPRIASLMVAILIAFLVRDRIDRRNHGLAAGMMLFALLTANQLWGYVQRLYDDVSPAGLDFYRLNPRLEVLGPFVLVLVILGQLEDRVVDKLPLGWKRGALQELCETRYWALPLAYALISGHGFILGCAVVFSGSYEIFRYLAVGLKQRGWGKRSLALAFSGIYALGYVAAIGWLLVVGMAKLNPGYIHSSNELQGNRNYVIYEKRIVGNHMLMRVGPEWLTLNASKRASIWIKAKPNYSADANTSIGFMSAWYKMKGMDVIDNWMFDSPDLLQVTEWQTGPLGWAAVRHYDIYAQFTLDYACIHDRNQLPWDELAKEMKKAEKLSLDL